MFGPSAPRFGPRGARFQQQQAPHPQVEVPVPIYGIKKGGYGFDVNRDKYDALSKPEEKSTGLFDQKALFEAKKEVKPT